MSLPKVGSTWPNGARCMNSWIVFQPPSAVPPMPSATSAAMASRLQKRGRPMSGTVTFSLGVVRRGCWPKGPLPKLPPPM